MFTNSKRATLRVLRNALKCIKLGWTRGALAKDANGKTCYPNAKKACRWCLTGAVAKVTRSTQAYHHALKQIVGANKDTIQDSPYRTYNTLLINFNDRVAKSKYAVMKVVEKAIAELKAGRDFTSKK